MINLNSINVSETEANPGKLIYYFTVSTMYLLLFIQNIKQGDLTLFV